MKLSISLPEEDVAILDRFAKDAGLESRSAAVQRAIRMLADPQLEADYATAWDEWEASGDFADWESTSGDGVVDAPR
ncbi:MAG: ribbon-helix-helix domain-containing protein [Candidatus Nanopelagicales bacterium]|nr:ribbon-helix-helix domain-containing protein [Candidatus Nanopelagicales bacterium]